MSAKVHDTGVLTSLSTLSSNSVVDAAKLDCHPDVELISERGCCCRSSEYYVLNQTFALVRHSDRMDHTEEWRTYRHREAYPNDTPLTPEGFTHAYQAGDLLFKQQNQFKLIVASPYFRCAQTASCIAQKLQIPVHFDLDLGEVFDDVSMSGDCRGRPQHRPPDVLERALVDDFPDVEYIRGKDGKIKVEGKLQRFPEPFDGARMRYCYKVQKLLQQAAAELSSLVIVSHGDAVAAVVGMMKETWIIKHIPYTAYCIASRQVRVLKKGSTERLHEEAVYVHPEQWTLQLDPGLVHYDCKKEDQKKAHKAHEKEMLEMDKKAKTIKTVYRLAPHQRAHVESSLDDMGAHDKDRRHFIRQATQKAEAFGLGAEHRIACGPDHHERHEKQKYEKQKTQDTGRPSDDADDDTQGADASQ